METQQNETPQLDRYGDINERSPLNKPKTGRKKVKKILLDNLLVIMIIIGAAMGFIVGIAINPTIQKLEEPDRTTSIICIGFMGELLIRMLKMLILPLIVSSLIVGLSNLDIKVSGKLGSRAIVYYLTTTVIAVILGMILVAAIQPGKGADKPTTSEDRVPVKPLDSFLDIIRNMLPDNIVKACVMQGKTMIVVKKQLLTAVNVTKDFTNMTKSEEQAFRKANKVYDVKNNTTNTIKSLVTIETFRSYKIPGGTKESNKANYLGLIVFSIAVGIVLGTMGAQAKPFVDFIEVLNEVVMTLVKLVMWYSPFGIWSLITAKFAGMDNIAATFESLGLFIVTVVVGLGIHGLIILPLAYFVFLRKNPFKYIQGLTEAMATAFGTDSSAATLPVTFRCLEENNNIDKRITRFVLPVGATINMDGTALYEAVAAIFIAQAVGRDLSAGDFISISITATLASIGAAAVPHAGLVTMLIVLDTVGLPTDYIGVIYSVDWFLDRCRTMVNVLGDSIGAAIVQHLSWRDLETSEVVEGENHNNEMTSQNTHL